MSNVVREELDTRSGTNVWTGIWKYRKEQHNKKINLLIIQSCNKVNLKITFFCHPHKYLLLHTPALLSSYIRGQLPLLHLSLKKSLPLNSGKYSLPQASSAMSIHMQLKLENGVRVQAWVHFFLEKKSSAREDFCKLSVSYYL